MASGASKGAKKIKPFDEQDTKLAMGTNWAPTIPITYHDISERSTLSCLSTKH